MKKLFALIVGAFLPFLVMVFSAFSAYAQEQDAPSLEYVMELTVTIGEPITVGNVTQGHRTIIPITGGTFEGPRIKGSVSPGGADYQLYDNAHGRNNLEAIYSIVTDDGEHIMVKNRGIATADYFVTSPIFETSYDGKYAWLNNGIYVCRPSGWGEGLIKLKVWKVK